MDWERLSERPTLLAWVVAGLPIAASVVQSVLALVRMTASGTPLEGLANVFHSLAVFQSAAIVFWQSPTIVFILVILVAIFWVLQGWAMFGRRDQRLAAGSAILVSALFFVLFFWVYAPLLAGDLPAWQLVLFFIAPLIASASALYGAYAHPWGADIADEALEELVHVENDAADVSDRFEQAFSDRIGDLDPLYEVSPQGVDRARERRDRFLEACDSIATEASRTRETAKQRHGQEEQLRRDAGELRSRLTDLDPEATVTEIENGLRDALTAAVEDRYAEIQVWSRYDRSYRLVNLPSRYREVHVSTFGTEIHLDHLGEALVSRIEDESIPPSRISAAIGEIDEHIERIEAHVAEAEEEFAAEEATVHDDLSDVRAKLDQFEGEVFDRLEEYVIEGRSDEFDSATDVEAMLDRARDSLHTCRFDEAKRLAAEARETASHLVRFVEFLRAVEGTIDHGNARVSLPGGIEPGPIEDVAPAFERQYDLDIVVDRDGLDLIRDDRPGSEPKSPKDVNTGEPSDDAAPMTDTENTDAETAPPEAVIDSVLYVIRELQGKSSGEEQEIQFPTDDLPESIGRPAVLNRLERFASHQSDIIDRFEVQADAPPGYITIVPASGVTPSKAVTELHVRYLDRYGS